MSFSHSSSTSNPTTVSTQQTITGSSAQSSPTLASQGDITYNDAGGQVSIEALSGMADVVKAALNQQGNLNESELSLLSDSLSKQTDANAQAASNNSDLLSTVLSNNAALAANVQSGGAASAQKTTAYVIFGVLALGAVALLAFIFRRSK